MMKLVILFLLAAVALSAEAKEKSALSQISAAMSASGFAGGSRPVQIRDLKCPLAVGVCSYSGLFAPVEWPSTMPGGRVYAVPLAGAGRLSAEVSRKIIEIVAKVQPGVPFSTLQLGCDTKGHCECDPEPAREGIHRVSLESLFPNITSPNQTGMTHVRYRIPVVGQVLFNDAEAAQFMSLTKAMQDQEFVGSHLTPGFSHHLWTIESFFGETIRVRTHAVMLSPAAFERGSPYADLLFSPHNILLGCTEISRRFLDEAVPRIQYHCETHGSLPVVSDEQNTKVKSNLPKLIGLESHRQGTWNRSAVLFPENAPYQEVMKFLARKAIAVKSIARMGYVKVTSYEFNNCAWSCVEEKYDRASQDYLKPLSCDGARPDQHYVFSCDARVGI